VLVKLGNASSGVRSFNSVDLRSELPKAGLPETAGAVSVLGCELEVAFCEEQQALDMIGVNLRLVERF
jgi:hypothetical protein